MAELLVRLREGPRGPAEPGDTGPGGPALEPRPWYAEADAGRPASAASPPPGFYPDPSIPGYVRFWNGGAWVPGTSRPEEPTGTPQAQGATAAVPQPGAGRAAAEPQAASPAAAEPSAMDGGGYGDPAPPGTGGYGYPLPVPDPRVAGAAARQTPGAPAPVPRVLWVTERPGTAQSVLASARADLATAPDHAGAVDRLARHPVDILVVDLALEGQAEGGFALVDRLFSQGHGDLPVVFYSPRVTPARERGAAERGAIGLTGDEEVLRSWVMRAAAYRYVLPGAPDST